MCRTLESPRRSPSRGTLRAAGVVVAATLLAAAGPWPGDATAAATSYPYVSWQEEFDGTSVEPLRWTYDIGTGSQYGLTGWGNNELQSYTSRPQNVSVGGGMLRITARAENYGGQAYTSARLKTEGLFSQVGGRFEIRAALPTGQGLWPAIWMLPESDTYGGWAASGEIDIMEARGQDPSRVAGTIHYGGSWPGNSSSSSTRTLPAGQSIADFHTYALEWDVASSSALRWYVDDVLYATKTSWYSTGATYPAPFDKPFYMLLNLAVGGNYVGAPNTSTPFPAEMRVDYVRAFTAAPPAILFDIASGTQSQAARGLPVIGAAASVTKTGGGTVRLDAANGFAGPTLVRGGTVTLAAAAAAVKSVVQVSSSAALAVGPSVQATVAGLTIDAGGRVDLGTGQLTVASGLSAASAMILVKAARGDGTWTRAAGIGSSAVAADVAAGRPRAVGWLDNGGGSVTFGYAAPGDTNLDGVVDVLDAAEVIGAGLYDTGRAAVWRQGDFNYDGIVDVLDMSGFLSTGLYDAGRFTLAAEAESSPAAVVAVPEPAAWGLPILVAVACGAARSLLRRKRGSPCRASATSWGPSARS
jgi:autotransporter-associated beta strand protein